MVHALNKGKAGEREFCKWLKDNLSIDAERELDQTRVGGADVIVDDFIIEVKRCETLNLKKWWLQVLAAAQTNPKLIPIVAFRQNRKQWKFLIPSSTIGVENGCIQLSENVFKRWATQIIQGLGEKAPL